MEPMDKNPMELAVDRLIVEGKILPMHRERCVEVLEEEMKRSAEAYAKAIGQVAVKAGLLRRTG